MSKRFFSGSKYFILGVVSYFILINLVDFLESLAIECGSIFPCGLLVELLTYISIFIFFVGVFKLIIFFWKDYKLIEKIKKLKTKYLDGKVKKKEEKVQGKCDMCGTINDVDAVFCKKCAASLKNEDEEDSKLE